MVHPRVRNCRVLLAVLVFMTAQAFGRASGQSQEPAGLKFEVVPTVFYAEVSGGLKQLLNVVVENPGPEIQGDLKVELGAAEQTFRLGRLAPGKGAYPIYLPDVKVPVAVKLTLMAGAATVEKNFTLKPQRKWTVYLFHHSHTDIGYTELQSRVGANHVDYLDSVIDYCRQTDGYPDDAKFRWNIEVSWALQYYRLTRPESKVRELIDLIRVGRVELSGLELQLSDCFAHEELVRSVYLANEMGRTFDFKVRAAMNNDVTGFSWALPQIFKRAGIRYFASGINEDRSRAPLRRPCAFFWESPDGSRILHWNGEHYLFANYGLSLHESLEKSVPKVGDYLAALEKRGDYPYDAIAFNISAWVTDNCPPGRELSDRVREWNNRWAYPKLRLATMSEFFESFEKKYASVLPVHKLGWPDYWTDGVASTAYETGLNRLAHDDLISAEKVSAVVGAVDPGFRYPGPEIRDAYDLSMLFDEHTWGAWNSISDPLSELARGQWTLKSSFAYRAREAARTLLKRGVEGLAKKVTADSEHTLVVFNPLSWTRTEAVRITLPARLQESAGKFRLIDKRTGAEVPFQLLTKDTLLFPARDIPALGYVVFSVVPGESPTSGEGKTVVNGNTMENTYYRITVDPVTGGILSLVDKETGLELADRNGPYPLNTYVHETPEGGRKAVNNMEQRANFIRATPSSVQCVPGMHGPVATSLIVKSVPKMCASLDQEVILYEGVKRVDLVNRLNKQETYDAEAVYFAFPFSVKGGAFRFEIADADMAPESEQLPGTTRDWQTVQNWVEIAGPNASIIWSPIEAPLIQFGDINTGKWLRKLELTNTSLYSYAMNNYWTTNFKAAQGGKIDLRYALTSRAGGPDRTASSRFGWEVHAPLVAAWVPAKNEGPIEKPEGSFFSVDAPNVIIQAVKRAEDGTGIVIRLREIAGKPANAKIASPLFLTDTVTLAFTDIVENEISSSSVPRDAVVVPMKPFEIQTIKIR